VKRAADLYDFEACAGRDVKRVADLGLITGRSDSSPAFVGLVLPGIVRSRWWTHPVVVVLGFAAALGLLAWWTGRS
jgi:hypothetical protein